MLQDKKVYFNLITDLVYTVTIRTLKEVKKYGRVTVELLTHADIHKMNDLHHFYYKQGKVVCRL